MERGDNYYPTLHVWLNHVQDILDNHLLDNILYRLIFEDLCSLIVGLWSFFHVSTKVYHYAGHFHPIEIFWFGSSTWLSAENTQYKRFQNWNSH